MNSSDIQFRLVDEIKLIPQDKLSELYDFIHFYRLGLNTAQNNIEEIMQFAGCWNDIPDEDFNRFLDDISNRRELAFSGRIDRETFAH